MEKKHIGQHISKQFNDELEDIRHKVLTMGGLVEQQLEMAMKAFKIGDIELAEEVIQNDKQINELESIIDKECVQILALRQPAAFDLRLLLAVIKMIPELERIGDKAARVAHMAVQLFHNDSGKWDEYYEVQHMAGMVIEMLHNSLDAFARMTLDGVLAITEQEKIVNREYSSIVRQLITQMLEDPRNITRALDVITVAKALERVADLSCNLCEYITYMIIGEDVRHISHEELAVKLDRRKSGRE
jgi:phosphate transport system protein